jgi:predicted RNA binding protein YcfA (HicA-like mRNA interferase family)
MRNPGTGRGVTVPLHSTVKRGTLAAILRQAGLHSDEFAALL